MASNLAKRLASEPVSKIELSVRCHNLLDKDFASKSDPICMLQMANSGKIFTEMGRTEQIKNNLNPVFSKSFSIDYFFEETQTLRFFIYDIDNATHRLDDDDYLGSMECSVGEIVSSSPFTRPLKLKGNIVAGKSTITVTASELSKNNEILLLDFRAKSLDNKDFFGKSDPYLEFHTMTKAGSFRLVHRTEVVNSNLNPNWKPFEINTSKLCTGDFHDKIKIECYDHDNDGSHDFIGSFETSVQEMIGAKNNMVEWPCINPKKKAKKKDYKNSGMVLLQSCISRKEFSFLDFVFGGLQINFTVGIDFTASNGDPSSHQSLHSLHPPNSNQYIRAIQSVGSVIQDYDSDRMFPALGYGANIPPNMSVSHCFPLTFDQNNPFCAGIQGVLDAYSLCLRSIRLYGPTNFSPIIHHVAQFASQAQRDRAASNYYILLIITDGVISDMDDTMQAIIHASSLPFSIIIVGVGNADFASMDVLDSDTGLLRDRIGNQAKRDIVQFVPFNQFASTDQASLAKQVLAEIPTQVVGYYSMMKIEPSKQRDPKQQQAQQPQGPHYNPQQPYIPGQQQQQQYPPQQQSPQQYPPQQAHSPHQQPQQYPLQQQPPHQQPPPGVYQTAQAIYPSLPSRPPQNPQFPPNPNTSPYPGQAPQFPPNPNTAPYPGQAPQNPGYPGQPPNLSQHPGKPPNPSQYPGQPPNPSQYPGQPPNPSQYPGQPPNPSQYPGQPPNPSQYPGQPPNPSQYPGQPPNPSQYPGQPSKPSKYPGQPPYPPNSAPYPPTNSQYPGQLPYNPPPQIPGGQAGIMNFVTNQMGQMSHNPTPNQGPYPPTQQYLPNQPPQTYTQPPYPPTRP